jgi:hypothetical protein
LANSFFTPLDSPRASTSSGVSHASSAPLAIASPGVLPAAPPSCAWRQQLALQRHPLAQEQQTAMMHSHNWDRLWATFNGGARAGWGSAARRRRHRRGSKQPLRAPALMVPRI